MTKEEAKRAVVQAAEAWDRAHEGWKTLAIDRADKRLRVTRTQLLELERQLHEAVVAYRSVR